MLFDWQEFPSILRGFNISETCVSYSTYPREYSLMSVVFNPCVMSPSKWHFLLLLLGISATSAHMQKAKAPCLWPICEHERRQTEQRDEVTQQQTDKSFLLSPCLASWSTPVSVGPPTLHACVKALLCPFSPPPIWPALAIPTPTCLPSNAQCMLPEWITSPNSVVITAAPLPVTWLCYRVILCHMLAVK